MREPPSRRSVNKAYSWGRMRLKNLSKRMVVIVLPHNEVCAEQCYCSATQHLQTAHNPATGDVGVRQLAMQVAKSMYLPAGAESEDLPEAFLRAQQVRSGIANRTLGKVA
jgi:hypothetical protein